MQFTEEQAAEVKKWVVKRLEDISDADSDVLADYVLALIRSDAPDEEIRKASIENLEDFLKENTVPFVDEIFARYAPKVEPPAPAPAPQQPPQAQFQPLVSPAVPAAQQPLPFNPPLGTSQVPSYVPNVPAGFDNSNYSRKRTYQEGFQGENDQGDSRNRSFKTPRTRRSNGGRGDRNGPSPGLPNAQFPQPLPGFPGMPQGFPTFNQNDPMAAMLALQSMGFPQMPGLPPLPIPGAAGMSGQQNPSDQSGKSDQPCPFYETNGICYMGAACPYKHGQDPVVVPPKDDEYDPTNAKIIDISSTDASRGSDRGRGQGRGRGGFAARGRGRAEFSHVGPTEDKSITTIVVENIPEDKFDEQVIRDYFSEFGNIVEVTMQSYKHLALVKFDDHAAAKRAWSSPKAVFDNRFVKVYWYKPPNKTETNGTQRPPSGTTTKGPGGLPIDKEEFERQQAEAQRQYEERMRKRKEMEEARLALEKQREELLKKQQEEKAKLMQKLGKATQDETNGHHDEKTETSGADDNVSEQTKKLRAQLAALEEEAKSLGIDPNAATESPYPSRGRGRGYPGYRGRGWYAPRGRGYDPSYRGGYRGRGAFRGRGASVLRLDNRPKRVAISGVEFDSEKDEALKQYLIGIGEYESIEPNPERPDSLIVAFKDRYVAEKLAYGPSVIPSVGKVQFSWVPNPPAQQQPSAAPRKDEEDSSSAMEQDQENEHEQYHVSNEPEHSDPNMRKDAANHEVDYDVAEVDDAWDVE
ncbi:hypothetical protein VTN77DRAFT_8691 [Rasamsonia byssochlamydoides]|uniref:uncharacterized protein n=1 Tax=Rasamsonia byssochlamydoides TaxID=89139 RepID=UPI003742B747